MQHEERRWWRGEQWAILLVGVALVAAGFLIGRREVAGAQVVTPEAEIRDRPALTTGDGLAPRGVAENVSSGFSYQGYLEEEGEPANGAYDFRFFLFDAETEGTALDEVTVDDVEVSEGLFTVPLTVTSSALTGQQLWLEVRVRPGADGGSYTTLAPRRLIQPAPYANTLRPGASIVASYGSALLTLDNEDDRGLYVEAGDDGIQVTAGEPDFLGYALGAGTGMEINAENTGLFVGRANEHGVWVNSAGSHGVRVSHANGDGVRVSHADGDGVLVANAAEYGVRAVAVYDSDVSINRSPAGVYGARIGATAGFGGHFVHEAGGTGLLGAGEGGGDNEGVVGITDSDGGEAIEAISAATSDNAHILLGCSATVSNLICEDIEFRVRRDGDVTADGSFTGGGADVADMLPVAGEEAAYEPGDVLVVNEDGLLVRSDEAYQAAVVGVYSTQPAFVGNPQGTGRRVGADGELLPEDAEEGVHSSERAAEDGLVPVALVGVVPVKVSGENGAIRPGDFLVSSSTAGHAMRGGVDAPRGTVIGKAMGSFDGDTGVIQMLVMLQ